MGVLNKLKDIFYDVEYVEEEVKEKKVPVEESKPELKIEEEEIKPEIKKVEIPKREENKEEPIKEEFFNPISKEEPEIKERELFQSKRTFKFPILDEEENEEVNKIPKRSTNVMEYQRSTQERTRKEPVKSIKENKSFKPSPVISPIYGVVDKEYSKEEIIKNKVSREIPPKEKTYENVRSRAFPNVKSDRSSEIVLDTVNEIEEELEKIEASRKEKAEEVVTEFKNDSRITIEELEEKVEEVKDITEEIKISKDEDKKTLDEVGNKTLEHDLFNLIDSMYEKEEE